MKERKNDSRRNVTLEDKTNCHPDNESECSIESTQEKATRKVHDIEIEFLDDSLIPRKGERQKERDESRNLHNQM